MGKKLAEVFWPGALTLVVIKNPTLPDVLSSQATVGVRMPNHPFTLALLQTTGPLATTSANLSGHENPLTAQDVFTQLGGKIELILDGGSTPGSIPSTVVDCTGHHPVILRDGAISANAIQKALED
jgi:L-threonylcarbamoyladenylate synthase